MEYICTAETAEDAEIALTWLSANSAVSAVLPAASSGHPREEEVRDFHRKTVQFITAVVVDSQAPNRSPQRNAHCRGFQ
jgi:hypothetical protein